MSEIPACDFHIHTKYLKCADETMEVPAIVAECQRLGQTRIGITDHLNTLEKVELHGLIKKDIEALEPGIDVFFGVELNYMGMDGDFAFNPDVKAEYGFQFAIGGIHTSYLENYDLKALVDIQHRHHLKACEHPLIDVLVHPYWFGKGEFDKKKWPWFDSMQAVPESYARELGQAAKATGTAIEINGGANLENPAYPESYVREYIDYLAIIAEEGATFMLGSDAHNINRLREACTSRKVAEQIGLTADRIWQPDAAPLRPGRKR